MRKEAAICAMLGLNQHDIAMLLGVSRSQWAMYETGKRGLPSAATQLLAVLLTHVQPALIKGKRIPEVDQPVKRQQQLERLLRENEYQQMAVERKLAAARKKQQSTARLLQLVLFLNNNSKEIGENLPVNEISRKANRVLDADHSADLIKMEIQLDILEIEKIYLESKLRNFTQILENIDVHEDIEEEAKQSFVKII